MTAAGLGYVFFLWGGRRFTDHRFSSFLTTLLGGLASYGAYVWTGSLWWAPLPFIFFLQHRFLGTSAALASHAVLVLVIALFIYLDDPTGAMTFFTVSWLYGLVLGGIRLVESVSQYFKVSLLAGLIFLGGYFLGHLMTEQNLIEAFLWGAIYATGQTVIFLVGFSLYFLYEMMVGKASPIKLMEMADMNHRLLQRLRHEAPGTFQHSLNVATLAQEAAEAIGANGRLVYVGALFHDVGKLHQPEYFIENFMGRATPHHALSPEESARIIIAHVPEGVKLARKHGLPSWIIDFIRTHHGTSRVEYFYRQFFEATGQTNDEQFRYPGPRPRTLEQAILMLADSIEAASRARPEWSDDEIRQLVNNIFHQKLAEDQLEEAPLSFPQMKKLQKVMTQHLRAILHKRKIDEPAGRVAEPQTEPSEE